MKNKLLRIFVILICVIVANAQDTRKLLLADGNKFYAGKSSAYLDESKEVFEIFQKNNFSPKGFGMEEKCYGSFYVNDSAEGFFLRKGILSEAFLYTACDETINQKYRGIIILRKADDGKFSFQANFEYEFRNDQAIQKFADLNGDGLDELGMFTTNGKQKMSFRILDFAKSEIQAKVHEIYNAEKSFSSKIYVEKVSQGEPKFFEEVSGKPLQEIELDEDSTKYFGGGFSKISGLLKHLSAFTFFLQVIAFFGLIGLIFYDFYVIFTEDKSAKIERKEGKSPPIIEDNLPKLNPINCQNCGAGVPLQEGEITCQNCGTKTSAPANYFDVAKKRDEINEKIREAAAYIKRADWLTSSWIRYATLLLAFWLIFTLIAVFVLINKGNFEPYQNYLTTNFVAKSLFGFATFTACFWIISLLFGFAIWQKNLKKSLPTFELNENLGKAETARCKQCGGTILYQINDLATICGYCGVETYRAKLAWKLRNLTNQANQKANFSLIEAQKSAEDAIWEIIGTPKVFAFLLILIAIFAVLAWLISFGYESLPSSVKDIFDLIGEILSNL